MVYDFQKPNCCFRITCNSSSVYFGEKRDLDEIWNHFCGRSKCFIYI